MKFGAVFGNQNVSRMLVSRATNSGVLLPNRSKKYPDIGVNSMLERNTENSTFELATPIFAWLIEKC